MNAFINEHLFELFLINDIMSLSGGNEMLLIIKIKKETRTKIGINLDNTISE